MSPLAIGHWFRSDLAGIRQKNYRRNRPRTGSLRRVFERLEDRAMLAGTSLQLHSGGNVNSFAGVGFQENPVAQLLASVNSAPDTNKSHFPTQIDWGDGETSTGDLVYTGTNGSFAVFLVKGSHIYQDPNGQGYTINVTVHGPNSASLTRQVSTGFVDAMPSGIPGTEPPLAAGQTQLQDVRFSFHSGGGINSYAGVGFQENIVAQVLVSANSAPVTDKGKLHAEINWGDDASWTDGDFVYTGTNGSFGVFWVKGSHVYQQPNGQGLPIVVFITGPDGTTASYRSATATINPMPSGLPGTVPPNEGSGEPEEVRFNLHSGGSFVTQAGAAVQHQLIAQVLVSTNGQPETSTGNLHPQINWGDDTSWSAGEMTYTGTNGSFGVFNLYGTHTYRKTSPSQGFSIVAYINGPDRTSASGQTSNATVRPGAAPTLGDLSPTEWTAGEPGYNGTIDVSGGSGGYQNLQISGLPAGLSYSIQTTTGTINGQETQSGTITISGTPKSAGVYNLTVSLKDGNGSSTSGSYQLKIYSAVSLGELDPTEWQQYQPGYDGTIPISGGSGGYRNLSVSGLPAGLSYSMVYGSTVVGGLPQQYGTITFSGTPTESGTFPIFVSIEDGSGAAMHSFASATAAAAEARSLDQATGGDGETFYLTINATAPIALGDLTPAQATVNVPYTGGIQVVGGIGPYTNAAIVGQPFSTGGQPLTASVVGQIITIQGTPTQAGTFQVTVTVQDSTGEIGSRTYSLNVAPAPSLTLNPAVLPDGTVNVGYSSAFQVTGGSGHYYFTYAALPNNSKPAGINFSTGGIIYGTPTKATTGYRFNVTVRDTANSALSITRAYTLKINPAPAAMMIQVAAGSVQTVGRSFAVTITAKTNKGAPYNGTVTLTSSNGEKITRPVTIKNGSVVTAVVLKRPGIVTLTAAVGTSNGVSNPIVVREAPATSLMVSAPFTATPGVAVPISIAALDAAGYCANFNGTVTITASDATGLSSPVTVNLVGGRASANIVLQSEGIVTLRATATVNNAPINGFSSPIKVGSPAVNLAQDLINFGVMAAKGSLPPNLAALPAATLLNQYGLKLVKDTQGKPHLSVADPALIKAYNSQKPKPTKAFMYTCAEFVDWALEQGHGKRLSEYGPIDSTTNGDYIWGDQVVQFNVGDPLTLLSQIQPGDVIQLRNVVSSIGTVNSDGSWSSESVSFNQHSAIVEKNLGGGKFVLLQQAYAGHGYVTEDTIDLSGMSSGTIWAYQPVHK